MVFSAENSVEMPDGRPGGPTVSLKRHWFELRRCWLAPSRVVRMYPVGSRCVVEAGRLRKAHVRACVDVVFSIARADRLTYDKTIQLKKKKNLRTNAFLSCRGTFYSGA